MLQIFRECRFMVAVHISKHSLLGHKITVGCLVCGVLWWCGGAFVWCVVKLGTLSLSLSFSLVLSLSSSLSLSFSLLSFFFSLLFLFLFSCSFSYSCYCSCSFSFSSFFFLPFYSLFSSLPFTPTNTVQKHWSTNTASNFDAFECGVAHGTFIATANELHGMFPPLLLPPPSLPHPEKREGTLLQEYFRRGNYFVSQFQINSEKSTPGEITVITVLYKFENKNLHHVKSVIIFEKMVRLRGDTALHHWQRDHQDPELLQHSAHEQWHVCAQFSLFVRFVSSLIHIAPHGSRVLRKSSHPRMWWAFLFDLESFILFILQIIPFIFISGTSSRTSSTSLRAVASLCTPPKRVMDSLDDSYSLTSQGSILHWAEILSTPIALNQLW